MATAPTRSTTEPLTMFSQLFAALRARGFEVGTAEYLKAHQVIRGLAGPVHPRRVKHLIGPIIVRSLDEQKRFYALFDEVYPELSVDEPAVAAHGPGVDDVEVPTVPLRVTSAKRARWAAATLGVVGVVVATIVISRPSPDASAPTPTEVTGPDAGVQPPTPQPQGPTARGPLGEAPFSVRPTREQLLWLTLLGPLLVFTLLELRARRLRHAVVESHRSRGKPLTWQTFERDAVTHFYDTGEVRASVRALLRREAGEAKYLSISGTIRDTIRALGYPRLRFEPRTRAPEYLVLIQRYTARDHQASLTDHLISSLEAEDLPVERFYYDSDPRVCYRAMGEPAVRLEELAYRYDTSRLLIFGDGAGLLHPLTGQLERWVEDLVAWPRRAFLTPVPPGLWAAREVQLAAHFVVAPATPAGLESTVDLFEPDAQWSLPTDGDAPKSALSLSANASIDEIESCIGPSAFRLLTACAVYPELHWDLTVQFASLPEVGRDGIDDAELARLFLLPWFRRGRIPEDVRVALLERVEPDAETATRREIIRLIEKNLAPVGSVAGEEQRVHLALQSLLSARGDRRERLAALKTLRRSPPDLSQSDEAGVRLLEHRESSKLALSLPEPLKQALFPRGGALFGMRTIGRMAAAAMVSLVGLAAVWTTGTPPVIASVSVTVPQSTMAEGSSQPYEVEIFDAAGASLSLTDHTVSVRSTTPSVGIEAAGRRVTALASGSAYVVASVGGFFDSVQVVVLATSTQASAVAGGSDPSATAPPPIASVSVTVSDATMSQGSRQPYQVAIFDAQGSQLTTAGRTVSVQSTSTSVVVDDANGMLLASLPGSALLIATAGGVSDSVQLVVVAAVDAPASDPPADEATSIASVSLSVTSGTMAEGSSQQYAVAMFDAQGNPVSPPTSLIRVEATSASISVDTASRLLTAGAPGDAYLVATVDDVVDSVQIVVVASVASVAVLGGGTPLTPNSSVALQAEVRDARQELLPGRPVVWSSSSSAVLSVDQSGRVTAVAPGSAEIVANSDGVEGRTTLVVEAATVPAPTPAEVVSEAGRFVTLLNDGSRADLEALFGASVASAETQTLLENMARGDFNAEVASTEAATSGGDQATVRFTVNIAYRSPFGTSRTGSGDIIATLTRASGEWRLLSCVVAPGAEF